MGNNCCKLKITTNTMPKNEEAKKRFEEEFSHAHQQDSGIFRECPAYRGGYCECFIKEILTHIDKELTLAREEEGAVGFLCGMIEENDGETFKGGCKEHVGIFESYRCSDCTAAFHRDCIRKHFGQHKKS